MMQQERSLRVVFLSQSADAVQLALKLDGTKLDGRSIRVKRSVKNEKQKKKTDGKGATGRARRDPATKGPATKGPGRGRRGAWGGFKSGRQQMSFSGEKADPNKKTKKKGGKKKVKVSKSVHI